MTTKFSYTPLPKHITIGNSTIEGLGLYTMRPLHAGEVLGITHGIFENQIWRTPLGGFINHSDNPNCELVNSGNKYVLHVLKNIRPQTELTVKYSLEQ
jgi:SET domain-containing protein